MIKNIKNERREKPSEARREHKKAFLIVLVTVIFIVFSLTFVSAANLTGYWKMNEGSGNASDSSDYSNTLMNHNLTTYVTGKLNNATLLNGVDQYFNVSSSILNFGTEEFTIAIWIRTNASTGGRHIIAKGEIYNSADGWALTFEGGGDDDKIAFYIGGIREIITSATYDTETWHRIIVTRNSSDGLTMHINNTIVGTASSVTADISTDYPLYVGVSGNLVYYFNGSIDDVRLYNDSWNADDVNTDWNNGAGRQAEDAILSVDLISPLDNSAISEVGTNFTANCSCDNSHNLTNASYYIWNSTGSIFNKTTVIITGTSNLTTQYIDELTLGTYEWNVEACYENSTGSVNCTFAYSNYSLDVGARIDAESYNDWTYETANERFEINISLLPGTNLHLTELYYNGTFYTGNILDLGSNSYSLSKNIDIPTISNSPENLTFYWKLTYEKADGSFSFQNLTSRNQSVYQIQLGNCAGALTTVSLNFTTWDEESLSTINYFDFGATFSYWLGNGEYMKNVSFNNEDIIEKNICISPDNVTYYLINSDIEYQANVTGYVTRNYYFENDTINNITQHINLYLLNSSDSTSFILKVVDQNQQEVTDALIYTQRYYPELGVYKTVQMAKTDENGKSIGFFKTETVDYRFIIEREGITELITSKQKVVPEETPYTLLFTIGVALDKPWADFDDLEYLDSSLTFNDTTNITTFTYIDSSGNFTQARLLVKELKYNQTDIIICNVTSSQSSDTLTCDLNDYSGTFIAQAFITRTTETTVSLTQFTITTSVEVLGLTGLFLGWFVVLVSGCAFLWHPIAGILGINVSVILVNLIGLISFSPLFIFGMIAVSVILIFVIKD